VRRKEQNIRKASFICRMQVLVCFVDTSMTCLNLSSRKGTARLSPVTAPPCMVHVIIRCRYGPTNILITSQYINYWPYNLAGTRRGISPRNVQTRSNVLWPFTSSVRRTSLWYRLSSLLLSSFSPFLFGFSFFPWTFHRLYFYGFIATIQCRFLLFLKLCEILCTQVQDQSIDQWDR